MTKKLKVTLGMDWAGPALRAFTQAALPVLIASGINWIDVEVWKVAFLSGGSGVFAYVQSRLVR